MSSDFYPYEKFENSPNYDNRGFFQRIYCRQQVSEASPLKQINHSFTRRRGTIRGLHYQVSPFQETKFVKILSGEIFDVIVNIKRNDPMWGTIKTAKMSWSDDYIIKIPEGYAHGFQTISDNVSIIYMHDAVHSPDHERGYRYDSPQLDINWPLDVTFISNRDLMLPAFSYELQDL